MTERLDGLQRSSSVFVEPVCVTLPDIFFDSATIAALSSQSWSWSIPDDDFDWYLAEFSAVSNIPVWHEGVIMIDGSIIYNAFTPYNLKYPNHKLRPYCMDLGATRQSMHQMSGPNNFPYKIDNGSVIEVALANLYAWEMIYYWTMSFYRWPT